MRVPTSSEFISNLVQGGALTIALSGGSAEDGKLSKNSIVEILINDRLHKRCRNSSGLVTHSEWMAAEEFPWLLCLLDHHAHL